jgi:hypothetical protein
MSIYLLGWPFGLIDWTQLFGMPVFDGTLSCHCMTVHNYACTAAGNGEDLAGQVGDVIIWVELVAAEHLCQINCQMLSWH